MKALTYFCYNNFRIKTTQPDFIQNVYRKEPVMSEFYYFHNTVDDKGNHEVHAESCSYLPNAYNRTMIGYERSCSDAIDRAKQEHPFKSFDGCYFCCRPCHTG